MTCVSLERYAQIENLRREDERRRAQAWRRLQQVGVEHQSWLSRQGCWLLCQLGRLMVRWGRQLQTRNAPQPS